MQYVLEVELVLVSAEKCFFCYWEKSGGGCLRKQWSLDMLLACVAGLATESAVIPASVIWDLCAAVWGLLV